MFSYRTTFASIIVLAGVIALLSGCSSKPADQTATVTPSTNPGATSAVKGGEAAATATPSTGTPSASGKPSDIQGKGTAKPGNQQPDAIQVAANPTAVTVLVNKRFRLPEGYAPAPLVEPNVAFIFKEKLEKRKMRKEAAAALEQLFTGAQKDGVSLAGVSGYRSEATQTTLFNNYAKKDGLEAANRYSAKPGFSEHQTGLVMDVSGTSGKCAAESCFADTKESKWLEKHAAEYGFIIRYPQGKESITGYQYEAWHIRYVGKEAAKEIAVKGITLEEYLNQAVPVSK